jgi:hypothetical protein
LCEFHIVEPKRAPAPLPQTAPRVRRGKAPLYTLRAVLPRLPGPTRYGPSLEPATTRRFGVGHRIGRITKRGANSRETPISPCPRTNVAIHQEIQRERGIVVASTNHIGPPASRQSKPRSERTGSIRCCGCCCLDSHYLFCFTLSFSGPTRLGGIPPWSPNKYATQLFCLCISALFPTVVSPVWLPHLLCLPLSCMRASPPPKPLIGQAFLASSSGYTNNKGTPCTRSRPSHGIHPVGQQAHRRGLGSPPWRFRHAVVRYVCEPTCPSGVSGTGKRTSTDVTS